MPRIKFTAETMPESSEEFQMALREAWENASPLDDLVELTRDLVLLEQQYGMDSAQFYERFQRGEMGDDLDYFDWVAKFEMHRQVKKEIEQAVEVMKLHSLPTPA
ncbi:MAG: hypothetical protein B6I35_11040 [Anaerolineaceae bacterium 4572_32.2]|nr:MAG: hypothetical protein B6I35_11040 [Anaerolineaceae bacterium 4572_32.2]